MKGSLLMETTAAEMMKNYVNSQKFSSTSEVMVAMKDMYKAVLQQVMEGELEDELGYGKSERMSKNGENSVEKLQKWAL